MVKSLWLSLERKVILYSVRLFRLRGENERVARGFALGLVVNLFPTFGFGVLISGFVARALGGNAVAGLIGGATLTFAWPLLFYLNIKVGSIFVSPRIPVDELADVSEKSVSFLMWGHTFLIGAVVNTLLFGGAAYLLVRFLHARVQGPALSRFRKQAREHQVRFKQLRLRLKPAQS